MSVKDKALYLTVDLNVTKKIQDNFSKNSKEKNETVSGLTAAPFSTEQCQNGKHPVKDKAALMTTQSKEKVQTDTLLKPERVEDPNALRTGKSQCSIHSHAGVPLKTKNRFRHRIFLGGLPDDVTESDVRKVFETYGKVIDVVIPQDKDTNKSKRYGFVGFEDELSAKTCIGDHFVAVNGKKVEIKEARPKEKRENRERKLTNDISDETKHSISLQDTKNNTSSCSELSCSDPESNQALYQKLFNDYFSAKFALQNLFGSETVSDAHLSEEIKSYESIEEELEKILMGFYWSAVEDDLDFSGKSNVTDSSTDDLEFDSTENDKNFEMSIAENFFLQNKGCAVCKWAPLDNSTEGLLFHLKTPGHKQRLKERFEKKDTSERAPQTFTQSNRNYNQTKKQHKNLKEKREKHIRKNKANESTWRDSENEKEKQSVLDIFMAPIEVKADKCIKCKVCNKTIPQTSDFHTLISNLSNHLQSKEHLEKIQKYKSFFAKLENLPENKEEMKINSFGEGEITPAQRVQKNSKKNWKHKTLADKTKLAGSVKLNKTETTDEEYLSQSVNMPLLSMPINTAKIRFRCLPCNFFCSKNNVFMTHLNSKSHSANYKKSPSDPSLKNFTAHSLQNHLTNCSGCDFYLYGSSQSIKDHFTTCRKPV